jgi:hypothetical protein
MNFFFICVLVLPLAITQNLGKNSHRSGPPTPQYRRFNILDKFNYILLQYEHQNVNSSMFFSQFVRIFKAKEEFKKERDEQEKKNKIYRDYLASRDRSSFSRDFHTLRY